MGVPLNAPPRPVNGFLVSGGPFADPGNYTYPRSLSETLEAEFNYQLHPEEYPSIANATDPEIIADFRSMIEQRFDVAEWFLEEESPDLLNITLFYINVLQHKAWDADEVKEVWKLIDNRLGELLRPEDDIIIHSDHGLHEVEQVFYMNAWLEQKGYLVTEHQPSSEELASSVFDWGESITRHLGIQSIARAIIPDRLLSLNPQKRRLIDSTGYESKIDFEASKAVALPQGPIYDLTSDDSFRGRLQAELCEVTDPSGKEIFSDVLRAEEVYSNSPDQFSPDLLVKWNDGFEIKDVHSAGPEKVFGSPHGVLADNAPTGILIAAGPNITDDFDGPVPYLYDLAPTLLHLHGHAVPEDMDGTVQSELISRNSPQAASPVETIPGEPVLESDQEDAQQDVNERLRDLGYLE